MLLGTDEHGVFDRQKDLQVAIDRYELLLRIARSPARFPDFSNEFDENKLQLGLAECRLCMCTLERTNWQLVARSEVPDSPSRKAQILKLQASLEEVRQLYQSPAVAKSTVAVQGQVRVLMETAELQAFTQRREEAIASLTEAIRLCYSTADEVTEAQLTKRIKELKRDADAEVLLEQLEGSISSSAEKLILQAAFERVVGPDGMLSKCHLKQLASKLSTQILLRDDEVNEMWSQILAVGNVLSTGDAVSEVEFGQVWRWWLKGDVFGSLLFSASKTHLGRKGTPSKSVHTE